MIELSCKEIIKATDGLLVAGDADQKISGISIDSRTLKPGDLFIAVVGEHHDGHDYIKDALDNGACGIVVGREFLRTRRGLSHGQLEGRRPHVRIEVDDTLKALQDIAHHLLRKVNPKVIAITGSTGKTTVKDMLNEVLSKKFSVLASIGNYNNEFGLPLTLLELQESTQIVIAEMGMRGKGQIANLCKIAPPDLALITNIGHSHLELLKSKVNIIEAKAEIIYGLKKGGMVFLNSDDPATEKLMRLRSLSRALKGRGDLKPRNDVIASPEGAWQSRNIVFFGKDAQVSYKDVTFDELARPSFTLSTVNRQLSTKVTLSIPGSHFICNATAVAAIALKLNLTADEIAEGLKRVKLTPGRMQIVQENGWLIINDSYNASPDSMKAAIEVLKKIKANRKIAILGDMLELGHYSTQAHNDIGKEAAKSGLAMLVTVGDLGKDIAKSAIQAGMDAQSVKSYDNSLELQQEIISYLRPDDAILIKASRAIELDIVANYLQNKR